MAAGYKWLGGPYTLGFLYLAEHLHAGVPLEENWMNRAGSEDFARLTEYTDEYRPGAARYCMGELSNFANVAMANAALEQLLDWGIGTVADYTDALVEPYWSRLAALGFALPPTHARAPHLIGLPLGSYRGRAGLAERLTEARVHVSFRGDYLRVSPHVTTRANDVEALLHVLTAGA